MSHERQDHPRSLVHVGELLTEAAATTTRRTRTNWTDEERRSAYRHAAEARFEDPLANQHTILEKGQKAALPPHRHRTSFTTQCREAIQSDFMAAWKEVKDSHVRTVDKVVEVQLPPPPVDVAAVLNEAPIEQLAEALFRRWAKMMTGPFVQPAAPIQPATPIQPVPPAPKLVEVVRPPPPKPEEPRKRFRIALIGCLSAQAKQVEDWFDLNVRKALGVDAELRCFEHRRDKNPDLGGCQHAIVNTKFCRHHVTKHAYERLGRKHVSLVAGGVETVRDTLKMVVLEHMADETKGKNGNGGGHAS